MVLVGQKIRDKVTGVEGICDNRAEFMFSAPRVGIIQPKDKDGKVPEPISVDECQVEVIDKRRVVSVDAPPAKYSWGQKAEDSISGFRGKITGRSVFMNGCAHVYLTQKHIKGELKDGAWFNEERIKPIGKILGAPTEKKNKKKKKSPSTGGPAPSAFRSSVTA